MHAISEGSVTWFSYLVLMLSVPMILFAYSRLPPVPATLAVIFGSAMFLPERINFDAPIIPALDKHTLPAAVMLFCVLKLARDRIKQAVPGTGIDLLMPISMLATAATVMTNRDAQRFGPRTLHAMQVSEVFGLVMHTGLTVVVPFLLGRILFRTAKDAALMLKGLVIAAFAYLPFVLVELRLSPQFHMWIYGYRQHDFGQSRRNDGWRPMCFMEHGLALTLFMCAGTLAAWSLMKSKTRVFPSLPAWVPAVVLLVVLSMLNSMGALLYAIVGIPLFFFTSAKMQLRVAAALGLVVALYPVLRAMQVLPLKDVVDFFAGINHQRSLSLNFRFEQEDMHMVRFLERPWFGWAGWNRNHVFTPQGRDISVIDGAWISILGQRGAVGLATYFGLLLLPVWLALRHVKALPKDVQIHLAGLAFISTIYTFDLLPNGLFNLFPMFFAGAVAGLAQGLPKEAKRGIDPRLMRLRAALALLRPSLPLKSRNS